METIQSQLHALLRINGQGCRNIDEEQGGGIGSARQIFNHSLKIQNERSQIIRFDDTSDEEADFGEFVHVANKEEEGSDNQITEETTNTN